MKQVTAQIKNFDKKLWIRFVSKTKIEGKQLAEVLEPLIKEHLRGKK